MGWTIPHVYNPSDPDADQELNTAEAYAKHAIEVLAKLPKPAGLTDEQFAGCQNRKVVPGAQCAGSRLFPARGLRQFSERAGAIHGRQCSSGSDRSICAGGRSAKLESPERSGSGFSRMQPDRRSLAESMQTERGIGASASGSSEGQVKPRRFVPLSSLFARRSVPPYDLRGRVGRGVRMDSRVTMRLHRASGNEYNHCAR